MGTHKIGVNPSSLSVGTVGLGGFLLSSLILKLHGSFLAWFFNSLQFLILEYHQINKTTIKKWEFIKKTLQKLKSLS
jgi:hypothetical protein